MKYKFIGDGAGIPGLPHEISDAQSPSQISSSSKSEAALKSGTQKSPSLLSEKSGSQTHLSVCLTKASLELVEGMTMGNGQEFSPLQAGIEATVQQSQRPRCMGVAPRLSQQQA
jgi:hypothetical protein